MATRRARKEAFQSGELRKSTVAPPAPKRDQQSRLRDTLRGIVADLQGEANRRVQRKREVEKRWVEDERQIAGEYPPEMLKELVAADKSQIFINQTRTKTNACEARLVDMMFPTDDKNYGVEHTPVPELADQAKASIARAEALQQQMGEAETERDALAEKANQAVNQNNPQHADIAAQADEHAARANELRAEHEREAQLAARLDAEIQEARKRAKAMELEIEDQLTECDYASQARLVIRDACRIGTGIIKGPIARADRVRRAWTREAPETEGSAIVYRLAYQQQARPAFVRVDPWSFFPDPDASAVEEGESTFERHRYTAKDLRRLAKHPGYDADAIRRLLTEGPKAHAPDYLAELRAITQENQAPEDKRFEAWEYRGPLTAEKLRDVCACLGTEDASQIAGVYAEVDPLVEIQVVIEFCEGEILKFGMHHLDSDETIYSVYNLDKDGTSPWGYGIPYMMRESQRAMNGAWRMMMDNAGLSSGPQIEIDQAILEPADGDWSFTARKIWLRKPNAPAGKKGIVTHNIESRQNELAAIIALAKQFMDDETNISVLAQGEQGAHTTQTAGGMSLLMNAVNVVFRRMVKNFDDGITVPVIRRIYDWNMQFSSKEHIKGDFEVKAKGTSVLLVREVTSQNLMVLANMTSHPILGLLLKAAPIVRRLVQAMMIPSDEVVKTDDELQRELAAKANEKPQLPPEEETKRMIAGIQADSRVKVALIQRETQLEAIAAKLNMTVKELQAKFGLKELDIASVERLFAAEVGAEAIARREAQAAGQLPTGSGGYISSGTVDSGRPRRARNGKAAPAPGNGAAVPQAVPA